MSNAISLIFFFSWRNLFSPAWKLYLKLSHRQVLMHQDWDSSVSLPAISIPLWEVGRWGVSQGSGGAVIGIGQFSLSYYDPKCATTIFSGMCCIEYAEWGLIQKSQLQFLGAVVYQVWEEGRAVEALHLSVASNSTGCTKPKEIIRLIKALSAFYYHRILSF